MSAPTLAENTDSPDAPEVNKPFWRKVYIVGITVGVVSILLNVWFKNGKWIDNFVKFVGKYIRNERIRAFIFEERKTIASFSLFQWMGATVTAILLMYCFDKIGETLASNDQIIKNIAYYTDYQIAADYPGIKKQFRYHLHENGVVSYAVKVNGKIQIQIDKLP